MATRIERDYKGPMCIALPKTKEGNTVRESAWKSLLLLPLRLLGLAWVLVKLVFVGLVNSR